MRTENKFRQKRQTDAARQQKYDAFERDHSRDAARWFRARPYALQYLEQLKNMTGGKKDV